MCPSIQKLASSKLKQVAVQDFHDLQKRLAVKDTESFI